MLILGVILMGLGIFSFQRGRAKKILRRPIYEGLLNQFNAATERFGNEPSYQNRISRDRCQMNVIYEGQRGRAFQRTGVILILIGAALAYFYYEIRY